MRWYDPLSGLIFELATKYLHLTALYLAVTGSLFTIFWLWKPRPLRASRIQRRPIEARAIAREIGWSSLSLAIYAAIGVLLDHARAAGGTRLYYSVSERGWAYLLASALLIVVAHDAYFYLTHRLLHLPWLYRRVHAVHHRSHDPSPFAAYSFHPVEAAIQAGVFALAAFLLPIYKPLLDLWVFATLAVDALGHLGHEVFRDPDFTASRFRWFNTGTHHNLHHQRSRWDFGLYFNWLDRLFGTLDPRYEREYRSVATRARVAPLAPTMRHRPRLARVAGRPVRQRSPAQQRTGS